MRRPHACLSIALLSVAFAAGCGGQTADTGGEFEGAEADVAEVVEDLQTAAQEDEARRVCTQILARALTQELGGGCARAVEQAFDDTDTSELVVEDVRVSGTSARARVRVGTDEDNERMLELVREGDVWRIAAFGGAAQ